MGELNRWLAEIPNPARRRVDGSIGFYSAQPIGSAARFEYALVRL
jgi:hypothetical protein